MNSNNENNFNLIKTYSSPEKKILTCISYILFSLGFFHLELKEWVYDYEITDIDYRDKVINQYFLMAIQKNKTNLLENLTELIEQNKKISK